MFVIIATAIGLSMDAFSLALLYGTNSLNNSRKILLSGLVGINHFVFPLIGKIVGSKILKNNIFDLNIITMIVFSIIGLEMIISSEKKENIKKLNIIEILLFAFSVSIDSFVIGITYQLNYRMLLSSLIFMIFSSFLTFIGLNIGRKINHKCGDISKKIGGLLIILIGLYSLFA